MAREPDRTDELCRVLAGMYCREEGWLAAMKWLALQSQPFALSLETTHQYDAEVTGVT
jgi:hypothetical protein